MHANEVKIHTYLFKIHTYLDVHILHTLISAGVTSKIVPYLSTMFSEFTVHVRIIIDDSKLNARLFYYV